MLFVLWAVCSDLVTAFEPAKFPPSLKARLILEKHIHFLSFLHITRLYSGAMTRND